MDWRNQGTSLLTSVNSGGRYEIHHKVGGTRYALGPVFRKSREHFRPEKPVVELQSDCFEKLIF